MGQQNQKILRGKGEQAVAIPSSRPSVFSDPNKVKEASDMRVSVSELSRCLVVAVILAVGFQSAFGQSSNSYTVEQLNDPYRSLTSDDRRALDSLSPELRTSELSTTRARLEREQAARIPSFEMDPSLREAIEYFEDWKNRDRETSVALFEKYLEKNPGSKFLPDIYASIGDLYGVQRNTGRGEKVDREIRDKYFKMAHEIWKESFSPSHWNVWATLATSPLSSFDERRKFYDWQLALLKENSAENIYPFAEMGQCYNGMPYQLSDADIHTRLNWLRENLESQALVSEKGLFQASTPEELRIWAKEYPDTMLGRQAAGALEVLNKNEVEEIDKLLPEASPDKQPSKPESRSTSAKGEIYERAQCPSATGRNSTQPQKLLTNSIESVFAPS